MYLKGERVVPIVEMGCGERRVVSEAEAGWYVAQAGWYVYSYALG